MEFNKQEKEELEELLKEVFEENQINFIFLGLDFEKTSEEYFNKVEPCLRRFYLKVENKDLKEKIKSTLENKNIQELRILIEKLKKHTFNFGVSEIKDEIFEKMSGIHLIIEEWISVLALIQTNEKEVSITPKFNTSLDKKLKNESNEKRD